MDVLPCWLAFALALALVVSAFGGSRTTVQRCLGSPFRVRVKTIALPGLLHGGQHGIEAACGTLRCAGGIHEIPGEVLVVPPLALHLGQLAPLVRLAGDWPRAKEKY